MWHSWHVVWSYCQRWCTHCTWHACNLLHLHDTSHAMDWGYRACFMTFISYRDGDGRPGFLHLLPCPLLSTVLQITECFYEKGGFTVNCSDLPLNIFLTVRQKENFRQYFTWGGGSYSLQNTVFCFCRPHTHTHTNSLLLVGCCSNYGLACLIFPISLRMVHAHFCVCLVLHIEWRKTFSPLCGENHDCAALLSVTKQILTFHSSMDTMCIVTRWFKLPILWHIHVGQMQQCTCCCHTCLRAQKPPNKFPYNLMLGEFYGMCWKELVLVKTESQ